MRSGVVRVVAAALLLIGVASCIFTTGSKRPTTTPPTVGRPSPSDYYSKRPCPAVRLEPAVLQQYPYAVEALVALKYALVRDDLWPSHASTVRPEVRYTVATILEDPNLVFEFSPPMPNVQHGGTVVAAQTIDGNRIRLSAFAGRNPYELARTMLHELVHVFQIRFQQKPIFTLVEPAWEIPAYAAERDLPFFPFQEVQQDFACRGGGPVTPPPTTGNCRPRRFPPGPPGAGDWVVWKTKGNWLRLGQRWEFEKPQKEREDIWGGQSEAPLQKQRLNYGPWMDGRAAIEEIASRLMRVRMGYHPLATPRETVDATLDSGDVHVRLGKGNHPDYTAYVGQEYDVAEEIQLLLAEGISPRQTFFAPQWLVHATGRGTYDGPQKLDQWMLITAKPQKGGFTIPDGSGGTQGYSYDIAKGPFADNFALVPVMRQYKIASLQEWAQSRSVEANRVLDPAVDHGTPLCPR